MQTKLFIDGEFVDALAGGTIDGAQPVRQLADLRRSAEARAEDVDRAVAAAQRRLPGLERPGRSIERGRLLLKLADADRGRCATS